MLHVDVLSGYLICGAGSLVGAAMLRIADTSDARARQALRLCGWGFVVLGVGLLPAGLGAAVSHPAASSLGLRRVGRHGADRSGLGEVQGRGMSPRWIVALVGGLRTGARLRAGGRCLREFGVCFAAGSGHRRIVDGVARPRHGGEPARHHRRRAWRVDGGAAAVVPGAPRLHVGRHGPGATRPDVRARAVALGARRALRRAADDRRDLAADVGQRATAPPVAHARDHRRADRRHDPARAARAGAGADRAAAASAARSGRADARPRPLQGRQRHARPPMGDAVAAFRRARAAHPHAGRHAARALWRRGVRRRGAGGRRAHRTPRGRAAAPCGGVCALVRRTAA